MTFEVFNQKLDDIDRKMSESQKRESDTVVKIEENRQLIISELVKEKRKYLDDWQEKFRMANTGAGKAIAKTKETERLTRRGLDGQRRRLSYEYNKGSMDDNNKQQINQNQL